MQKRLFIGISIPKNLKKRIFQLVDKEYKDLPVKWVQPNNFHLTLNFLGYVRDENIPKVCQAIEKAAGNTEFFEIDFRRIDFGPNAITKKMIWVTGEKSENLENLKFKLDMALGFFVREKKKFIPHITLGRIRSGMWSRLEREPPVERDFSFSLDVSSLELLESRFEKGKRIYYVLESFSLK